MITSTILMQIFTSKAFLITAGSLIGGLYLYFKGRSAGVDATEASQKAAEEAFKSSLKSTEFQNIKKDREREKQNKTVDSTNSIPSLIQLWRKLSDKKDSDH